MAGPMARQSDPRAWFAPLTLPRSSREGELCVIKMAQMGNEKTPAMTLIHNMAMIPAHTLGVFSNVSVVISFGSHGTHFCQSTLTGGGGNTKYNTTYIASTVRRQAKAPNLLCPHGNRVICKTMAKIPAELKAAPIWPGVISIPPSSILVEQSNGNN